MNDLPFLLGAKQPLLGRSLCRVLALLVTVLVTSGPALADGDAYEPDDTKTSASEYLIGEVPDLQTTQSHDFHASGDVDWVRFSGFAGRPYTFHAEDVQGNCDPVVELYDSAGSLPIATWDDNGVGEVETAAWDCTTTGVYYWKVYNYDPLSYGTGTGYTVRLEESSGANNGLATILGPSSVRASWAGSPDPGDLGFNVYRKTLYESSWTHANPSPIQGNSHDVTGLTPQTFYLFVVRAVKPNGDELQFTPIFYVETPLPVEVSRWTVE